MAKTPNKKKATPSQDIIGRNESMGFQLWAIGNAWQRHMRTALLPYDLTHVQYLLLATLLQHELSGATHLLSQNALSMAAGTDKMMTSKVVRALVERQLLVRQGVNNDLRAYHLILTDTGRDLVKQAAEAVVQAEETFFAPVAKKADKLAKYLYLLAENEAPEDSED